MDVWISSLFKVTVSFFLIGQICKFFLTYLPLPILLWFSLLLVFVLMLIISLHLIMLLPLLDIQHTCCSSKGTFYFFVQLFIEVILLATYPGNHKLIFLGDIYPMGSLYIINIKELQHKQVL